MNAVSGLQSEQRQQTAGIIDVQIQTVREKGLERIFTK